MTQTPYICIDMSLFSIEILLVDLTRNIEAVGLHLYLPGETGSISWRGASIQPAFQQTYQFTLTLLSIHTPAHFCNLTMRGIGWGENKKHGGKHSYSSEIQSTGQHWNRKRGQKSKRENRLYIRLLAHKNWMRKISEGLFVCHNHNKNRKTGKLD